MPALMCLGLTQLPSPVLPRGWKERPCTRELWHYRPKSVVPATRGPESHRCPLTPGKAPDRPSRDPSSGGTRGQDRALVSMGEQERTNGQRGEAAAPRPAEAGPLTRAWEMH